jgi:hypothetical protein
MSFQINPYAIVPIVVTELARDTTAFHDTDGGTAITSDARNIGTASPSRQVYALISAFSESVSVTLTSVTIGGVAATERANIASTINTNDSLIAAIFSANVPTGITAAVAATFSSSVNGMACSVIALDGLSSAVPVDSATAHVASGTVTTGANIDQEEDGYVMGVACGQNDSGSAQSATWTELTKTVDNDLVDGADEYVLGFSVAYKAPDADAAGTTITATFTNANPKSLCVISLR